MDAKQDIELYGSAFNDRSATAKEGWHTDIPFEAVPSDYALLRLTQLPADGGGDTLWASGYEVYDRISQPYQRFLESLTATYTQPEFERSARRHKFELFAGPRGAPENVGTELRAVHPVVRTNPVTGTSWFANEISEMLIKLCLRVEECLRDRAEHLAYQRRL